MTCCPFYPNFPLIICHFRSKPFFKKTGPNNFWSWRASCFSLKIKWYSSPHCSRQFKGIVQQFFLQKLLFFSSKYQLIHMASKLMQDCYAPQSWKNMWTNIWYIANIPHLVRSCQLMNSHQLTNIDRVTANHWGGRTSKSLYLFRYFATKMGDQFILGGWGQLRLSGAKHWGSRLTKHPPLGGAKSSWSAWRALPTQPPPIMHC